MNGNGEYQYGGLIKAITAETFGKCGQCGGELDYRDLYRNHLCAKCRREQDKLNRTIFLNSLRTDFELEHRVARLEALLYDHEVGHPNKNLLW